MTSNGQVTIPTEIRRQLAIEPGDRLFFEPDNEGDARFQVFHRLRRLNVRVVDPV